MGWIADFDDEPRLEALDRCGLLDTPPESAFDNVTALCADLLDVPIALVSLVDRDRQWFKSRVGLDATETARSVAFCDHAIRRREILVVEDATADARFADNPLVTDGPRIRFYAGVPLRTADGHALGTLCAIDRRPRTLSAADRRLLEQLAHQVELEIELRRRDAALRGALDRERNKQRNKELLAAMAVHDLRSPLTGIALSAIASLDQDLTATHQNLHFIAEAARRAQGMLSNLLDLCLSQLDGLETRPVRLSTAFLVEDVVSSVRPFAEANDVAIATDAAHVTIDGDPDLLRRALINIVENALRAAPRGSSVRCDCALGPGGGAVIAVADRGPGIADADKERVLAPLEQGPSESQGSRGLGLAFCASAVAAHGGTVRVEDNQPRGTRIVIELPPAHS